MPIRDVGARQQANQAEGKQQVPPNAERALKDAGLAKNGTEAKQVAQQILGQLKAQGFNAPPQADLGAQLKAALGKFQKEAGLPGHGDLDQATLGLLALKGMLPKGEIEDALQKKPEPNKDGFERSQQNALSKGEGRRSELAKNAQPDANFVDGLLSLLAGTGQHGDTPVDLAGKTPTPVGDGGAEVGTKSTDEVQKARETEDAKDVQKKTTKESEAPVPKGQMENAKSRIKVARGLQSEAQKTEDSRRKDTQGISDPTQMGILEEEAEEDEEGVGDNPGKRKGRGGDTDGGTEDEANAEGARGEVPEDGTEREVGNAQSGDVDSKSDKRGHASEDDGSGASAGHYEMESLSAQAFAAIQHINRDASPDNRATTYSWDVTFYKPGVYGAGQKATALLHLVVKSASAFDTVWQKAQANLQVLVKRVEPDGDAPSLDDIIGALRQARARDGGDESAATLRRVRHIGKP